MVKYKLLKEMPMAKVGSIFAYNEESDLYEYIISDDYEYRYSLDKMNELKNEGWFEIVVEKDGVREVKDIIQSLNLLTTNVDFRIDYNKYENVYEFYEGGEFAFLLNKEELKRVGEFIDNVVNTDEDYVGELDKVIYTSDYGSIGLDFVKSETGEDYEVSLGNDNEVILYLTVDELKSLKDTVTNILIDEGVENEDEE